MAAIKYDNGAPALSRQEEEKISKDVGAPGVLTVNISYTTNGEHSASSLHYSGQAADITKVNGQPVHDYHKNPAEKQAVDSIVKRANQNKAHEVFAPGRQTFRDGSHFQARTAAAQRALERQHENHVHIAEE